MLSLRTSLRTICLRTKKSLFLQLAQAEKREEWLRGQVETAQETIKLLEHKQPSPQQAKKAYLVGCSVQSITIKQYRLCLWAVHQNIYIKIYF